MDKKIYQENTEWITRVTDRDDENFPRSLLPVAARVDRLYFRGRLPDPSLPAVAIVGARLCTPYGARQAFSFAAALAARGVQIISGMAEGVDAAAHEGALSVAGGRTFGILGCGTDIAYPAKNRSLYYRILKEGGILGEYPDGTVPRGFNFPARNRIISGLSMAVVVAEAREKSGSLITVDYALEQGKTVFAIPGRVEDSLSQGCNRLIAQGAQIACSPAQVLEELKLLEHCRAAETGDNFGVAKEYEVLYSCLDFRPKSLEELQKDCPMSAIELRRLLMEMEIGGLCREVTRNYFMRQH